MRVPTFLAAAIFAFSSICAAQSPQDADAAQAPQENYVIGRQDVLNITVLDQKELSGKYTVEADGNIRFPMVNVVPAAGRTLRELEADLAKRLVDGQFLKNPQISVNLDQFRGQRVFIFGGVASPGTYPLTDGMTILDAMVKAGYGAASEAIITRPKDRLTSPVTADRAPAGDKIVVNLRELEKDAENGVLSRNIPLCDGDYIFVPRVDRNRIFVTGEVKTPGAYSVPEGTTVLQAVSLAGGFTEIASAGRIKVIRIVKGQKKTIGVKLEDLVQPGDTIIVPQRIL
jgi:polysaccharide export outer membrane protein